MPYSNSIQAFPDVRQLFDQALTSDKGLVLTFETEAEAITNAGRFNAFRVRDRKENAKVYPADHPMHGNSPYDGLQVQVRKVERKVIIKKLDIGHFNVAELE